MTYYARVTYWLSAMVLVVSGAAGPAMADEPKPLVWAADQEGGLPYIGLDSVGKLIGFEVEIRDALVKELKRPIEFKQYEFENLLLGLKKGDFDFAMNGLEITAANKMAAHFTKPYYAYRQQLVVRKDETRIYTFEDCKRLKDSITVGTLEGCAAQRLLEQSGIPTQASKGQLEPYQDLGTTKRLDAVLMDLPIALQYAKNDPKLRFTGEPFAKGYYAIAVRPDDPELADQLDAAVLHLWQDGTLENIYRKWGLWDSAQEQLRRELKDGTWSDGLESQPGVHFAPSYYLPLLGQYALTTIELTVSSFALAMLLGLPIAVARLYSPWWVRGLATCYVEFFRGVPVMFLLFLVYYGLPAIAASYGWNTAYFSFDPFWAATLGLGLNYAAYEAEIYRAGIQCIPAGQWEAAACLGMSAPLTFRRIILPQTLRSILPPSTGDLVALFKDTSIASTIGLIELNKEFFVLAKSSGQYVEIGLVTAALYLLMSVPVGYLSRRLEKRWGSYAA